MTKLLIVDDEPYTVEMLETFLQLNGFETVGALNGEDGLVLVKVERPAVLILDLMLPDIEGFEVCRRIRSYPDTASLPVLILSARADADSKERALAAGANDYLVKPVRFPILLETLQRLLESPVPETTPKPVIAQAVVESAQPVPDNPPQNNPPQNDPPVSPAPKTEPVVSAAVQVEPAADTVPVKPPVSNMPVLNPAVSNTPDVNTVPPLPPADGQSTGVPARLAEPETDPPTTTPKTDPA